MTSASTILAARVLTKSVLALRVLVPLGHGHVHVGRLVVISAVVTVLIGAFAAILILFVAVGPLLLGILSRRFSGIHSAVGFHLGLDVLEACLSHVDVGRLRLAASVTAHVHGVAVSFAFLHLVDLGSRWGLLLLTWRQDRLLHHDLVLVLLVLVLEVSPLGQDLHGLDVLNGGQLLSIVLVAAQGVQVDLLAKSLVLVLHHLQDGVDLLAVQHLLVVHTCDGVEDGPHHLGVVHSAEVVTDVQAEDDLVQFGLLDSDSLVAQRWWQLPEEIWQSDRSHVELAHGVVLGPGVLEGLDILLLKGQDVVLVLRCLVVVETLTDNGNEDVHENEERHQLECCPEENGQ